MSSSYASYFLPLRTTHRRNQIFPSHGTGAPLVFVHAGYQDLSMWDPQVTYFKKYNTVITVDMPGHGLTKGVDTTLLVKDMLRILLDSLHIPKASFVGLSLGGSCVTDFVPRWKT